MYKGVDMATNTINIFHHFTRRMNINQFTRENFLRPMFQLVNITIILEPLLNITNIFAPAISQKFDSLDDNTGRLCEGITRLKQGLVYNLGKVDCRIKFLQDNLGVDPGIANISLRNPWEGLVSIKSSMVEIFGKFCMLSKTISNRYQLCMLHFSFQMLFLLRIKGLV